MSKIILLFVCFSSLQTGYCQVDPIAFLIKQKNSIDSLINGNDKINFYKKNISGKDSLMKEYNGSVLINSADNNIKSITLTSLSSPLKATLYCNANTIILVKENDNSYYCIDKHYYSIILKEISPEVLKRMIQYEQIQASVLKIVSGQ